MPLYTQPRDLVMVDLGRFRDDLRGRRVAGRVRGGSLDVYDDRQAIAAGSLAGRGLEIVWVDDAVDAFFLHIQGSGRIELDDGSVLRVGYSAQNGHSYHAIGRTLIDLGEMELAEVSLQSIDAWLRANPDRAAEVMATNPSYVFFREIRGEGPVGAQGVALTTERSLAVDRLHLPLGVPVWLDAMVPAAAPEAPDERRQWLLVAQDTGGAIRGAVRGDVYWGSGERAKSIAGRMAHRGRVLGARAARGGAGAVGDPVRKLIAPRKPSLARSFGPSRPHTMSLRRDSPCSVPRRKLIAPRKPSLARSFGPSRPHTMGLRGNSRCSVPRRKPIVSAHGVGPHTGPAGG